MRRSLRWALAAALLAAGPSAAPATTWVSAEPHDRAKAHQTIRELVAQIDNSDFAALRRQWGLSIYSDKFGRIEGDDELRAFLADMNSFEGKPDHSPYDIYRIHRIVKDKYRPTYSVYLTRLRWHAESYDDVSESPVEAGYRSVYMTWLATFSSDQITDFRETPELFKLGIYGASGG